MLAGVAEALEADMLDRRSLALLNPYLVGLLGSTHAWNGILNWAQELMTPLREGNMRRSLQFQRVTSCSGQIIKTDTKFHQQASKPWTGMGGRMIQVFCCSVCAAKFECCLDVPESYVCTTWYKVISPFHQYTPLSQLSVYAGEFKLVPHHPHCRPIARCWLVLQSNNTC